MSVFHENMLIGSSGQGGVAAAYQISRSVRFNSADSAYLSKTPASAGNRKTWTWAGWIKRSRLGLDEIIFDANNGNDYISLTYVSSEDTLQVYSIVSGGTYQLISTAKYRDTSAWAHVVLAYDTTQATASNRVRLYVNGSQLTAFNTATYPPQNADTMVNNTVAHQISGRSGQNQYYFNGYLADINFIDGQALTPTSFGEFDTNNVWQPKAYSGTYGTNGFHLEFADNSNNTATTLGKDTSGNGNNFTPNNLSVTAGAGNDSVVDTPTNYGTDTGTGGEVRGSYCTLSPVVGGPNISQITFANGNLEATWSTSTNYAVTLGTIGVNSGKWYWETTIAGASGYWLFGIATSAITLNNYIGQEAASYGYYSVDGTKYNANSSASYGNSYTTNDIIGIALDLDNGKVFFSKNGTWQNSGNPASGTNAAYTGLSGTFFPAYAEGASNVATAYICNFGSRPFAYTAPSGFKALCTTNLPTPTIADGSTAMDVVTYTGTGSALTPTSSLNFSPDLIWIKSRSAATDHSLYDIVRGTQARLESNNTDAEVTSDGGVTAFNSNGFTLGTLAQVNTNAATYVGWCWDGGTSTVTNTNGTITSSVRANASAGISIITYTGNGTQGATIGHGLSVAPSFLIIKQRNSSGASAGWWTFHASVVSPNANWWRNYARINMNDAFADWGDNTGLAAAPSSTVVTVGNYAGINSNGNTFVCYAFASVSGFSAMGTYLGNGSADGPFVYTGMRPRWILVKASSTGGSTYDWFVYDTARDTFNAATKFLMSDDNRAEQATADAGTLTDLSFDILSNGFKVRTNRGRVNLNATTFAWVAFAENPFSLARAR